MGDFQDMRRSLTDAKRLEHERQLKRRGLVIEIASWVIVFAAIAALIIYKAVP